MLVHEEFRDEVNEAIKYYKEHLRDVDRTQGENIEELERLREELQGLRPKVPPFYKKVQYSELKKGMWVSKETDMEINLRKFGETEIEIEAQKIGQKIFEKKCAIVELYQAHKKAMPNRRRGRKAILAEAV